MVLWLAAVLPARCATACLWDRDTVRDEERGLPGINELLAGKFERHSQFYYQTRVANLGARIGKEPQNLPIYDDLAVAYEKLGDHGKAIDVMLLKEKQKPGEYTTYANLGTFYLHSGDLETGIRYIRRALEINPNAHFGREEYQLKLAEFYLAGKTQPAILKKENLLHIDFEAELGEFRSFSHADDDPLPKLGLKPNVFDGITGIIRFGTGTSAELYYVLGELLAARGERHAAYAAYRRAVENNHPRSEFIRGTCMPEVRRRIDGNDHWDDDLISRERAEADAWVKAYQDFEDGLIRAGKDADDAGNLQPFYAKYGTRELSVPAQTLSERMTDAVGFGPKSLEMHVIEAVAIPVLLLIALFVFLVVRYRKRATRRRAKAA